MKYERLNPHCIQCLMKKQIAQAENLVGEKTKVDYLKAVMRIFADAEEEASAPVLAARIHRIMPQYGAVCQDYREIKMYYNELMMKQEKEVRRRIMSADHPLLAAFQFARIANYIDFSALDTVDEAQLYQLLDRAEEEEFDSRLFDQFQGELHRAETMVYITDNCGEIVFDKLAVEQLMRYDPQLKVTVLVRGQEIVNDATMEDAHMIGLDKLTTVIGNGTAIAGTYLPELSDEAVQCLKTADVIVAKGQGNFESMNGCGLNIYYSFLCKCDWFVKRFQLPQFKGVFLNERDL